MAFCARPAAAFPCFGGVRFGNRFLGHCLAFWPCALRPWLWQSSASGFFLPDSDVSFSVRSRPRFWCVFEHFARAVLCQSCAKGFFLLDSDVPFSVRGWLRFWAVFEQFARALPLRFPVLSRGLRWQNAGQAAHADATTCVFILLNHKTRASGEPKGASSRHVRPPSALEQGTQCNALRRRKNSEHDTHALIDKRGEI